MGEGDGYNDFFDLIFLKKFSEGFDLFFKILFCFQCSDRIAGAPAGKKNHQKIFLVKQSLTLCRI